MPSIGGVREWIAQIQAAEREAPAVLAGNQHFLSIPWCRDIINDPNWIATTTPSRQAKSNKEDTFFAETLQTSQTIRNCLTLFRRPGVPTSHTTASSDPYLKGTDNNYPIQEVTLLLNLGSGVNGYADICHGGFVSTILDEIMGILITVNLQLKERIIGEAKQISAFTAYLNVTFKRPVPTPGPIMGRCWFERVEGRKTWIVSTVEDGAGGVFARAEGMFLEPKAQWKGRL
ncbi:hypothetical protein NA57DRAFT_57038 [Rhizodiscina lignyota]|uniref:Thioesterase domain-containing protein n=1 Tax=Rhizodiscina lignyota TaxID=1504668 RepID=A0A9P4IEM9_9PEZI|nr:hypothetical protein NA57DRAFT_57038 [Rhizodiscina lignyota]